MGGPGAILALLRRNADFRRLFLASVVSLAGDWFAFVAVSGLVAEVTGREGLAAVVFAASVLPVFLASPLAGVLADRVDRRRLMITVDLLRIVPALGLVAALHLESAGLAIGCVVTIATLSAFFEPVVPAVAPNLLRPAELSLGQAAIGAVWGSMLFVGAALGGIVAATFGRQTSFLVNAATFLLSAVLVLRIRAPFSAGPPLPAASVFRDLGEVWRFVHGRPVIRALVGIKAGVGVGNGIVGLLPAFAIARFGGTDAAIGLLLAARGAGALMGPFVGRAIAGNDGRRILIVCGGSILFYGLTYAALPLTGSLALAALCVGLAHLGGGAQWVLSTYGLQVTTPDALRGRVLSLDFGLATAAVGISSLVAGAAVEILGLTATCWWLVALSLAYGTTWLWRTRALWRQPDDPFQPAGPGATRGRGDRSR